MKSLAFQGIIIAVFLIDFLPADEIRSWTDQSGKFSVQATALEFDGAVVVLQKEDERILKLPLLKLSLNDQAYLKAKGPFKAEDNPFGETGNDGEYDATDVVFPAEPQTLQTDKTVIAVPAESTWSYEPDPSTEISLPKAESLRFSLGNLPHELTADWSDLYFNNVRPSNVLACVNLFRHMDSRGPRTARLFSADAETGKTVSAGFPAGYSILDLSPDGSRLLLRQVSEDRPHGMGEKSTLIHVVRLSRDLRPTHQACYEPFALEGWDVAEIKPFHEMTPEEQEARRKNEKEEREARWKIEREERDVQWKKRIEESRQRAEKSRAEAEARKKMTPAEQAADTKKKMERDRAEWEAARNARVEEKKLEEKKDRLGRTIPSRFNSFSKNPANVQCGFWLDDNRILLQSDDGTLISMDVDTGEVLWSIPSATKISGSVVLSPGKRYCLVGSALSNPPKSGDPVREGTVSTRQNLHATPTEISAAMQRETTSRMISTQFTNSASSAPMIFDAKNGRFCGRLEAANDCIGVKAFDFSPDGKTLAALGGDDSVVRWQLPDGKRLPSIYFSLPYEPESRMSTPSGQIEKVYDNQEKPTMIRWADNRYLKVGTVLIDTITEAPVWRYISFNSGFQKNFGRYYWFVNTLGSDTMEIIPKRIPSSQVPGKESTAPDANAYSIVPGTEVALRVDESITKDRDKITEALTKKLTDNGWKLNPDASVFLLARIGKETPRNLYIQSDITSMSGVSLTYMPGNGAVKIATITPPRYEVLIKDGDRVLWQVAAVSRFSNLSRDTIKNKTAQEQIDKDYQLMNYTDWFTGLRIPKKIRPETLLKETSVQMLGAD